MHVPFWVVREDVITFERRADFIDTPDAVAVVNMEEWEGHFASATGIYWGAVSGNRRLPDEFDPLVVKLPDAPWDAPDYVTISGFPLVSERFRDAIGDMPDAIQYPPVALSAGNRAAVAQDYRLLNVLCSQPAMDLARSKLHKSVRRILRHDRLNHIPSFGTYVLRGDLVPQTEIFWDKEILCTMIAVDALAERVMKAGCTGIQFTDPATISVLNGIRRYRSADGVTEQLLG